MDIWFRGTPLDYYLAYNFCGPFDMMNQNSILSATLCGMDPLCRNKIIYYTHVLMQVAQYFYFFVIFSNEIKAEEKNQAWHRKFCACFHSYFPIR